MTDERKGRPSASLFPSLETCPGKWNATRGIESESSADAESGNVVHAVLAGVDPPREPTADELETAAKCEQLANDLAESLYGRIEDADTVMREERFWADDWDINSNETTPWFSGKFDLLACWGTRALIVDYKTGRNEVTESARNAQLRCLAAIVAVCKPDLSQVTVAIVQPWVSPQTSVCTYSQADLFAAVQWSYDLVGKAMKPDAPRIPGEEQCRYCQAKSRCPEAMGKVRDLALAAIPEALAEITPEKLNVALKHCAMADVVIKAVRAEAKRRLIKDPEAVPQWRLRSSGAVRKVADVGALFTRLSEDWGVTPQAFTEKCKVGLGEVKALIKDRSELKGRALDDAVDAALAGNVEETLKAPALAREK